MATLVCRDCGKEFTEILGKPGFMNQCQECSLFQSEPEPIGGNMVWEHKTAPRLELKPLSAAVAFAKQTERYGAGVTKCLVESKLDEVSRESSKKSSGAESGASYRSRIGEARTVK